MHVTYRATVTAMLHIGPHECKTGKQCQFGQDLTIIRSVQTFSIIFCGILGIGGACYI